MSRGPTRHKHDAGDRVDVSSYGRSWFSTHYYVEVDGQEVFRILGASDVRALNRDTHPEDYRYRVGEVYGGFDSQEEAVAAAKVILEAGIDRGSRWPTHVVKRESQGWAAVENEWVEDLT